MDDNKVRMALNPLRSEVVPLHGAVTSYKWGKQGRNSVAAFFNAHNKLVPTDPDKQYSEFILSSQVPYQATIAATPSLSLLDFIQSQVIEVDSTAVRFYQRLHSHGIPYILKIVSVAYPQPLRVHPDAGTSETLAEELGFQNPNEKPSMLVALGPVDLFFGFQSATNIVSELLRVPEFADAVGRSHAEQFVRQVKSNAASPNLIKRLIMSLLGKTVEASEYLAKAAARLQKMPKNAVTANDTCFLSLQELYPVDPMCFAVYFLNRVELSEGNAIFVHENEPYCVLNGDFIEASTSSDAVVVGGLTDEETNPHIFAHCLSYDDSPVEISDGERVSEYGVSYVPPVSHFQLLDFRLPGGISQQMVEASAPSVILVLAGTGYIAIDSGKVLMPLRAGSLYYLSPQTSLLVSSQKDSLTPLRFFQIGVNESAAPSQQSSCSIM